MTSVSFSFHLSFVLMFRIGAAFLNVVVSLDRLNTSPSSSLRASDEPIGFFGNGLNSRSISTTQQA